MGNKSDSTTADGLVRTHDLFADLLEDVGESFRNLETNKDSQYLRRAVVRSVFTFIEAVVHIVKRAARRQLTQTDVQSGLSKRELEVIWERIELQGEMLRIRIPADENLKRSFSILGRLWRLPEYEFDAGGAEYEYYRHARYARNRLSHPRTFYDIEISVAEMDAAARTYVWIKGEFLRLWKLRHEQFLASLSEEDRRAFVSASGIEA